MDQNTTTISSSDTETLNGREFNKKATTYILPVDATERDRLNPVS
jgi:hypothetical protein